MDFEDTLKKAKEKLKDNPKLYDKLEKTVQAVVAFPSSEDRQDIRERREQARLRAKETL